MTEAEWLKSVNSEAMIAALHGKGSDRLWRLYAVACVRPLVVQMRYDDSRKALDIAERYADGTASHGELHTARVRAKAAAWQAAEDAWNDEVRANFCWDAEYEAVWRSRMAAKAVLPCVADEVNEESIDAGLRLADLLLEVFGNPFQWKQIDPIWLAANDGATTRLARTIYDERAFDQLPILADALEDAGCTDEAILTHLRSPGPHVRGCWALDLLLDKS